jgi:hypothetical protein
LIEQKVVPDYFKEISDFYKSRAVQEPSDDIEDAHEGEDGRPLTSKDSPHLPPTIPLGVDFSRKY